MKDFDRYSKEFYASTKNFSISTVLRSYQLPNSEELHSMICGEAFSDYKDSFLYDYSQSIDYFEYEKVLWNLENLKT